MGSVTIRSATKTGQATLLPCVLSVFIRVHPWLKCLSPNLASL